MPSIFEAVVGADTAKLNQQMARNQDARAERALELNVRQQGLAESSARQKRMSEADALKASTLGGIFAMLPQVPAAQRGEVFAAGLQAAEGQGIRFDAEDVEGLRRNILPILDNDAALLGAARGLGADVQMPEPETFNNPMAAVDANGNPVFMRAGNRGSVEAVEGFAPPPRSPVVEVNTGDAAGYKVPQGFMLKDSNDPAQGVTPIPGGPQDEMAAGDAGKAQMLRSARSVLPEIDRRLFGEDGSINRFNIANAQAGTPFTEGRELDRFYEIGIQAITRLETGAAMPPDEVNNTRRRFQPTPLDSDATIRAKRVLFGEFLDGALDLIDPAGRFDEEAFQNELDVREIQIEQGGGFSGALGRMVTAQEIAAEAEAYNMTEDEVKAELEIR